MNKFQAMAQAMVLLNEGELVKPGSKEYKTVRRMISEMIDRMGPDAAINEIRRTKSELQTQIKIMCMWNHSTCREPATRF